MQVRIRAGEKVAKCAPLNAMKGGAPQGNNNARKKTTENNQTIKKQPKQP
jgi:hypothetical protein